MDDHLHNKLNEAAVARREKLQAQDKLRQAEEKEDRILTEIILYIEERYARN